jgi:hypothetical protein
MRRPTRKSPRKKRIITRSKRKVVYSAILLSVTLVISCVFLLVYSFSKFLNQSFVSALSAESGYYINQQTVTGLAYIVIDSFDRETVMVKKLTFIVFDKSNGKLVNYSVPVNLEYDISGKYSVENLSKMFALGSMASGSVGDGITTTVNTVKKLFGFGVDRYLVVDEKHSEVFDELLGNGSFLDLIKLKDLGFIREHFKTDMTLQEFYSLFNFIKGLPEDRLFTKEISTNDLTDSTNIDADLRDITLESNIAKENKSIAILNGTELSGIATVASRIVANLGGRVVSIGNSSRTYSESVLITDDPSSLTTAQLVRVFGITKIVSKTDPMAAEKETDRSDIAVIMGFDTASLLY